MEIKVTTLDGTAAGSVDLPDAIFGLEARADILHRCVNWQLSRCLPAILIRPAKRSSIVDSA